MRRFAITRSPWLGLAGPSAATRTERAQPPATAAAQTPAQPATRRPRRSRPGAGRRRRPAPTSRSLFEPTRAQFLSAAGWPALTATRRGISGTRISATGFSSPRRYAFAQRDDDLAFRVGADNVGWRDQRLFGVYERIGKLALAGNWEQIPQFYSVDTSTPYTGAGGALMLDDAMQRAIQNTQANLMPISRWRPRSTFASGGISAP